MKRVYVHGEGRVEMGRGVRFETATAPIELFAHAGAVLRIGDGAAIEGGTSIEALQSISIGARARVGAFCKIMDNDLHVAGAMNELPPSSPVEIEAGAVVGPRCILLPGARVRAGEVLRAGVVRGRR